MKFYVHPHETFDTQICLSVWDCRTRVHFEGIDVAQFCSEKEKAKLEQLALESIEKVGGAINWSGIYPPSPKLCRYVLKLVKRHALQITSVKLQQAKEEIKKLKEEVKEKSSSMWHLKKAVQRYVNRTKRDEEFLQELLAKKIFNLIYDVNATNEIKEVKQKFTEYYKTVDKVEQDFTEDAKLLRAGYVIVCIPNTLPCL